MLQDEVMEFEEEINYFNERMDLLNSDIEYYEMAMEDAQADQDEEYIKEIDAILGELYEEYEMD